MRSQTLVQKEEDALPSNHSLNEEVTTEADLILQTIDNININDDNVMNFVINNKSESSLKGNKCLTSVFGSADREPPLTNWNGEFKGSLYLPSNDK